MPLTKTGSKVLKEMEGKYGAEKGKGVFYSSIKKNRPGSKKWHEKHKSNQYSEALKKGC